MITEEQKIRIDSWDDTLPSSKRRPKTQAQLARELKITSRTITNRRKKREAEKKAIIPLEKELDKISNFSTDELLAIALKGDNAKMSRLAKIQMWFIGMKEGNYKSLESYLKATGEFVEKREETYKIDGSSIAPAVLDALEELERQGVVKVQIQPSSLSGKLCLTSGQGEEKDNKV